MSLYLGALGKSASNTQVLCNYCSNAQVVCATDGKMGIPGGVRQEMVGVQWSRAVGRMVTHTGAWQCLISSLLLFYIFFCISW